MTISSQILKLDTKKGKEIEKKQTKRILDTELINKYKQEYNKNIHNIQYLHKILFDIQKIKPQLIPKTFFSKY